MQVKNLLKALSLLLLLPLLSACNGINSAYNAAHEACVIAETADPIIQSFIPGWGATVEEVVSIICAIPSVISDFQGLPGAQATQKTHARLVTMGTVMFATDAGVKK